MTDEHSYIDEKTGTRTVGHEWDGIEELDTPMPRWWLWTFFGTILFAIGYTIVYPAWPGISGATPGIWHWRSHGLHSQLQQETEKARAQHQEILAQLANTPIEQIVGNQKLEQAAIAGGEAAFKVNCVQCHGENATGSKGYPNLTDDDWLWGGDLAAIQQTITHGIRYASDPDTRTSQMSAFGRDGILTPAQIQDVVAFVRVVSKQDRASAESQRGAKLFQDNCAVCHGADAKGNRQFGAPNLTDPIWLYGGDVDALTETVTDARQGVMPAWTGTLDPVTIKMLAVYVHSLGGGEATPAPAPAPAATTPASPPVPAGTAKGH